VEGAIECLIASGGDIRLDSLRVDAAAILKHDRQLARKKRLLWIAARWQAGLAGSDSRVERCKNRGRIVGRDVFIQRAIRIDLNQRPAAAQAQTTDTTYFDSLLETSPSDAFFKPLLDCLRIRRETTGRNAAADADGLA